MGKPRIFEIDKPIKIVLGVFGSIFVLLILLMPAINRWSTRVTRTNSGCHFRLTILYSAILGYTSENEGRLPPADRWCDEIAIFLPKDKTDIENPFLCIVESSKGERVSSYRMNASVSGRVLSQLPKDTVILFESRPGWNRSGGPTDMSFENHRYWEDAVRCGILLANGEGWCMDKKTTSSLRWEP